MAHPGNEPHDSGAVQPPPTPPAPAHHAPRRSTIDTGSGLRLGTPLAHLTESALGGPDGAASTAAEPSPPRAAGGMVEIDLAGGATAGAAAGTAGKCGNAGAPAAAGQAPTPTPADADPTLVCVNPCSLA